MNAMPSLRFAYQGEKIILRWLRTRTGAWCGPYAYVRLTHSTDPPRVPGGPSSMNVARGSADFQAILRFAMKRYPDHVAWAAQGAMPRTKK